MWILVFLWAGLCVFLLREQHRLTTELAAMRASIRRVDDHLDDLGLVFTNLAEAPTSVQIERAEASLISLMTDLMGYQEAV
jgi:hypothetical protein